MLCGAADTAVAERVSSGGKRFIRVTFVNVQSVTKWVLPAGVFEMTTAQRLRGAGSLLGVPRPSAADSSICPKTTTCPAASHCAAVHQRPAAVCDRKPGEHGANILVCSLIVQKVSPDVVGCSQEHVSPGRQSAGRAEPREGATGLVLRSRVQGVRPQGPQGGQVNILKTRQIQDTATGCESSSEQTSTKFIICRRYSQGSILTAVWLVLRRTCAYGKNWHARSLYGCVHIRRRTAVS